MAQRPTMGRPVITGTSDNDHFNVTQDGQHYRISRADLDSWNRQWDEYESGQKPASAPAGGGGMPGGGMSGGGMLAGGYAGGGMGGAGGGTFAQAASLADPWAAQRGQYQTALQQLMTGGVSAVAADPSVQARMKAGTDAVGRSMAAQGYLGSGNILEELQAKGQEIASQEYGNQFNRLSRLAGVDAGSPAAAGSILAQAPGQALNEARFGLDQQRFGLDQQQAAQQAGVSDIEKSLLQQQFEDMQLASRQKIAGLEREVYQPVAYGSSTIQGGMWAPDRRQDTYVDPRTLAAGTLTNSGQTIDQIIAQRRAQVGLK